MANTVNVTINVNLTDRDAVAERKPYDNREVKPDEVLVPMMVNDELLKVLGDVDTRNIRVWQTAGRRYRVMFYPVPSEFAKLAMQQFNSQLNEFLGERRDARCLVPQPDGSLKTCPKKRGNNHPDCAHCPNHGKFEREDKSIAALDELLDGFGYEPLPTTDDTDPMMLRLAYEDLLTYLEDKPRFRDIVVTGFEIGSDGSDFATGDRKRLIEIVMGRYGIKRSRAYQLVGETLKEAEKFLYN